MNLLKIFFIPLLFFGSCGENNNTKDTLERDGDRIRLEANSAYERNDHRNAILLYSELLKGDSTNGEYYFKRGYSYSMLFDVEDAVKDYKNAIVRGHRVADAYNNIGANYATIDDSLALEYFNKALKAGYRDIKIHKRIAECKKRLNDANKQFDK